MIDIDTLGAEKFDAINLVQTQSHDSLITKMERIMYEVKMKREALLVDIYQNMSKSKIDHEMIEQRILAMKTILEKLESNINSVKHVLDQDLIELCNLIRERRAILGTISDLTFALHHTST